MVKLLPPHHFPSYVDETIHYVKIFTDMNRYPQLESYYVGSQKVSCMCVCIHVRTCVCM